MTIIPFPDQVPDVTPYHGDVIDSARRLAFAEHVKQKHGDLPYGYHLTAVAGLVSCFTRDPDVIAAAWLHDIIEDCEDIDEYVVEQMTNKRVARLVALLTDPKEGTRAEKKLISMPRIMTSRDASLIKLADRFHNHASTILEKSPRFARLYAGEFFTFIDLYLQTGWSGHPLLSMVYGQLEELRNIGEV